MKDIVTCSQSEEEELTQLLKDFKFLDVHHMNLEFIDGRDVPSFVMRTSYRVDEEMVQHCCYTMHASSSVELKLSTEKSVSKNFIRDDVERVKLKVINEGHYIFNPSPQDETSIPPLSALMAETLNAFLEDFNIYYNSELDARDFISGVFDGRMNDALPFDLGGASLFEANGESKPFVIFDTRKGVNKLSPLQEAKALALSKNELAYRKFTQDNGQNVGMISHEMHKIVQKYLLNETMFKRIVRIETSYLNYEFRVTIKFETNDDSPLYITTIGVPSADEPREDYEYFDIIGVRVHKAPHNKIFGGYDPFHRKIMDKLLLTDLLKFNHRIQALPRGTNVLDVIHGDVNLAEPHKRRVIYDRDENVNLFVHL